jgi:hypothetical protein
MAMEPKESQAVPTMAGRMPPPVMESVGKVLRQVQLTADKPLIII